MVSLSLSFPSLLVQAQVRYVERQAALLEEEVNVSASDFAAIAILGAWVMVRRKAAKPSNWRDCRRCRRWRDMLGLG